MTAKSIEKVVLGLSLLAILGVMVLAVVHVDDRYRMDVASGARVALVQYADRGELYPELYDGEFFGGTRSMPLGVVLHQWLSNVTGEYVASGKILTYATMSLLLIVLVVLLSREGCPRTVAVGFAAVVLVTRTGFGNAMSLRGDALPLLLQIGALALIATPTWRRRPLTPGPMRTTGSAFLAGLALMAKLSALWAAAASLVWLVRRDRRRAFQYLATYVVTAGGLLWVFAIASEGRIYENVFGLADAGVTPARLLLGPYRLVQLGIAEATAAWLFVPLAISGLLIADRPARRSPYTFALIFAIGILVLVLIDIGTGWNQLIDLAILIPIVLAITINWKAHSARRILSAVISGAIIFGAITVVLPELRHTVALFGGHERFSVRPLEGYPAPGSTVLSEDPYVPVSMGQTPVILDPFMLLRIGQHHPSAVNDLIQRIRDEEFAGIVLVVPLVPRNDFWWRDYHLGTAVADAIDDSYVYVRRVQGYYLYEPQSV